MEIALNKFLISLSKALDFAENEIIGASQYHAERVALMSYRLAVKAGLEENVCFAIAQGALLHDCALGEYLNDEFDIIEAGSSIENMMCSHCEAGEAIARKLPSYNYAENAIKYHHEQADGNGAYGLKEDETPLHAQLIHISDQVDVHCDFSTYSKEKVAEAIRFVKEGSGTVFSKKCADWFLEEIDEGFLENISGEQVGDLLIDVLPKGKTEVSMESLKEMSTIFADITDYKSHFTWRHSIGVADKALRMSAYYEYSEDESNHLYIAGLLHDVGKLLIPESILEKPGKLDENEYKIIQNHAMGTWNLLKDIDGLEEIARCAALHHEKLDGTGYPFGLKGDSLSKNERLLSCLDIYQALTEERPYKKGMPHQQAMAILNKMGASGQLDQSLIDDIDQCFGKGKEEAKEQEHLVKETTKSGKTVYRCTVCGYEYDGELPKDFICPRCEQPSAVFEKIS